MLRIRSLFNIYQFNIDAFIDNNIAGDAGRLLPHPHGPLLDVRTKGGGGQGFVSLAL